MKMRKRKWASLGLALIMAVTMILSNVGMLTAEASETGTLNFAYRYGANNLIQVNTNLPSDTPLASFTAGDNGCNIDQSGNQYQQVGWIGMDNVDGTIVLTFHFNSAFATGQTYVLPKGAVFGFTDGSKYALDKDYTFTWDGSTWTMEAVDPTEAETLELAYRYGTNNLIQVNTNLPADTPLKDFTAGDNGCDIDQSGNQYQQVGWIQMLDADGTIVLTFHFNSEFATGQTYVLAKDSIFGFTNGKKYKLDQDYTFTFNGTDWKEPEPEPEPTPEVTFEYRSGTADYIQVNTSLPADTPLVNFTAGDNGCALDETQNQYQNVGWIGMDNADGVIVLTFHFNKAFEKDQTYVLAKDSIFGFTNEKKYKLDQDYTFTFYGTDWVKPAEHIHKYEKTTVKATTTKAGSITEACACGDVKSKTVIPAASKISLSKTAVSYNKKTQKVTVSVKDSKGKALAASQYSVSGTVSAKKVGTYKVKVTLKGNYTGSTTLT